MSREARINAVLQMYENGIGLKKALQIVTTSEEDIKKWVEWDTLEDIKKGNQRKNKDELLENIEQLKKSENIINFAYQLAEDVQSGADYAEDHYDLARTRADAYTLKTLLYYLWEATDEE